MSHRLGIYPELRWLRRHTLDRDELRRMREDRDVYSTLIAAGDLVFDIGASWGEKTETFLALGATVVAVEPQAECLDELVRRCVRHRGRVVPVLAAVGDAVGMGRLFIRNHREKSGLLKDWQREVVGEVAVPITTLDDLAEKYGSPTFVKIDVEGVEDVVLKGLSRAVGGVSLEYHLTPSGIDKVLRCADQLAALSAYEFNISPAEHLRLEYSAWLTLEHFRQVFPERLRGKPGFEYGDVFVRRIR